MNPFDLKGLNAIVTGSSKGIGRGIAEAMAAAGAQVVVSSRKEGPCQEVVQGIAQQGGKAIALACNVGQHDQVLRLVDAARKQLGPIDVLVCNAAANPYYGPLADAPEDAYRKTVDTGILSTLWLVKEVLPDMKARGGGAVILISSIGSLRGSQNLGLYAVAKAAMNQTARTLAAELGPFNVRVNAILPGLVKTDFARALWDTPEGQQRIKKFPLGRVGMPEDIAPAAVFLASRAGQWMTGQTLVIDGGATIQN